MLNASALIQQFSSHISVGVDNIFLCTREGALLCSARKIEEAKPTAAIVSTIWGDYEVHLPVEAEDSAAELTVMMLEGSQGSVVACQINSLCLSVIGTGSTGKLLETLKRLRETIKPALESIPIDNDD